MLDLLTEQQASQYCPFAAKIIWKQALVTLVCFSYVCLSLSSSTTKKKHDFLAYSNDNAKCITVIMKTNCRQEKIRWKLCKTQFPNTKSITKQQRNCSFFRLYMFSVSISLSLILCFSNSIQCSTVNAKSRRYRVLFLNDFHWTCSAHENR